MYKKYGCSKCNNGEIRSRYGGGDYYPSYDHIRCSCSYRKTKKFKTSKQKDCEKFYDNHSSLGSSAMDGW